LNGPNTQLNGPMVVGQSVECDPARDLQLGEISLFFFVAIIA
jgi:hypothetical protein